MVCRNRWIDSGSGDFWLAQIDLRCIAILVCPQKRYQLVSQSPAALASWCADRCGA